MNTPSTNSISLTPRPYAKSMASPAHDPLSDMVNRKQARSAESTMTDWLLEIATRELAADAETPSDLPIDTIVGPARKKPMTDATSEAQSDAMFTPKSGKNRVRLILDAIHSRSTDVNRDAMMGDVKRVTITSRESLPTIASACPSVAGGSANGDASEDSVGAAALSTKELRVATALKKKGNPKESPMDRSEVASAGTSREEERAVSGGNGTGKKQHPWTSQEDMRLKKLLEEAKFGAEIRWKLIADRMQGRSCKQCRERWHNHLRPNVVKGNWEPWEDEKIIELQKKMGNRWATIKLFLPHRTDNDIKNRWHSFMRTEKRKKERLKSAEHIRLCAKKERARAGMPFLLLPVHNSPAAEQDKDANGQNGTVSDARLKELVVEQLQKLSPDPSVAADGRHEDVLKIWMEENNAHTPGLSSGGLTEFSQQSHVLSESFSNFKWTPLSSGTPVVIVRQEKPLGHPKSLPRADLSPLILARVKQV